MPEPTLDAIAQMTGAAWALTNRTDLVRLGGEDRVVVQTYPRPEDAEQRVRVMRGLRAPAAAAGIAIPRIREFDLDGNPAWVIFDVLPGVPVPVSGEGLADADFPARAREMGELLASFRGLPTTGLELDDLWTSPRRLAARAADWMDGVPGLIANERAALIDALARVPELFEGRPAVLAHGDFAPVNVLVEGTAVTGLLDFESVRLADPLFDVAWWAWSVSFSSHAVLEAAWPEFLRGAGIDASDRRLADRVRSLQLLRMLELLADPTSLAPGVRNVVADRLRRDCD